VLLAWAACIIGFAIGVLGCSLLAFGRAPARAGATSRSRAPTHPRRASGGRATATTDVRRAPSSPHWSDAVAGTARETLAVLSRLASGTSPNEAAAIVTALRALAARFERLAMAAPGPADGNGQDLALIELAARGARAEASRCAGVVVMTNERRAFLDALRTLRDLPRRVTTPSR
jgi:hypothetical protein